MKCHKGTYFLVVIGFVNYVNAGFLQNFVQSFTGGFETPSWPETLKWSATNETNSNDSQAGVNWARGYDYEPTHHSTHHGYQYQSQNLDFYTLLAGISFAALLGAAIVFLATRNTTGRRRRSLDENSLHESSYILDAIDDPYWERKRVQTIKLL